MVLAKQSITQQIVSTPVRVLFDVLSVNEDVPNYNLTHGGLVVAASGMYNVTFTANVSVSGSIPINGGLTAHISVLNNAGVERLIRYSTAYGNMDTGRNCTLNNQVQLELAGDERINLYVSYDGSAIAETIAGQSILTCTRFS